MRSNDNFFPFIDEEEFQFVDFIYTHEQMSAENINILMQLMAAWHKSCHSKLDENSGDRLDQSESIDPPFNSTNQIYDIIDSIPLGNVP